MSRRVAKIRRKTKSFFRSAKTMLLCACIGSAYMDDVILLVAATRIDVELLATFLQAAEVAAHEVPFERGRFQGRHSRRGKLGFDDRQGECRSDQRPERHIDEADHGIAPAGNTASRRFFFCAS